MRLVRSFSTALRRYKQPLYEPYIAPLNEEQKKALRKELTKYEPVFNQRIMKDAQITLRSHAPSRLLLESRQETRKDVQTIIQKAYGERFRVIDTSLWEYAIDIAEAPLELTIIDTELPEGIPPGTETRPPPGPYDHRNLASVMLEAGFHGTFIDGDAQHMVLERDAPEKYDLTELGPEVWQPPWPDYDPFRKTYISYPPVLNTHAFGDYQPFLLKPPMPVNLPLLKLLKAYFSATIFKEFLSILYLWVISIDFDRIPTTCLALMAIHVMQELKMVPNLQNPDSNNGFLGELEKSYRGVWIQAELLPSYPKRTFWVETTFGRFPPEWQPPETRKIKRLLHSFFDSFATHSNEKLFVPAYKVFSVQQGLLLDRDVATSGLKASITMQKMQKEQKRIDRGDRPWEPLKQPPEWITQPLIIADPFIPSYNHARGLTSHHVSYLTHFCSVSRRVLTRGHPLSEIFGPKISFPTRRYSVQSIGREARTSYEEISAPEPVLKARKATIRRVNEIIQRRFGDTYYVRAFGSTEYGVSTATSDVDMIILDNDRKHGFTTKNASSKLPPIYDTKSIGRILFRSGFTNVLAIAGANVPIVKFRDPKTNLDCDININDRLGLINTALIRSYCDLVPDLVRPMIMTIKRWAKLLGLNNPSGQGGPVSFSSYTFSIMIIGYLQYRGILPNLQAGFEPLQKKTRDGVFWIRSGKGKHQEYLRCDVRFNRTPEGWTPPETLDLGEALYGFFKFWSEEFPYETHYLSIRHGRLMRRDNVKIPPEVKKQFKKAQSNPQNGEDLEELLQRYPQLHAELEKKARQALNLEEKELLNREENEDAAVAALHEMEKELAEGEHGEEEEEPQVCVFDISAAEEIKQDLPDESSIGPSTHKIDVERFEGEVLDAEQASGEAVASLVDEGLDALEDSLSDVESVASSFVKREEQQSPGWAGKQLVISDPFVRSKNLATNIAKPILEMFRFECARAAFMMQTGESLSDVIYVPDDDNDVIAAGTGAGYLGRGKRGAARGRRGAIPITGRRRGGGTVVQDDRGGRGNEESLPHRDRNQHAQGLPHHGALGLGGTAPHGGKGKGKGREAHVSETGINQQALQQHDAQAAAGPSSVPPTRKERHPKGGVPRPTEIERHPRGGAPPSRRRGDMSLVRNEDMPPRQPIGDRPPLQRVGRLRGAPDTSSSTPPEWRRHDNDSFQNTTSTSRAEQGGRPVYHSTSATSSSRGERVIAEYFEEEAKSTPFGLKPRGNQDQTA